MINLGCLCIASPLLIIMHFFRFSSFAHLCLSFFVIYNDNSNWCFLWTHSTNFVFADGILYFFFFRSYLSIRNLLLSFHLFLANKYFLLLIYKVIQVEVQLKYDSMWKRRILFFCLKLRFQENQVKNCSSWRSISKLLIESYFTCYLVQIFIIIIIFMHRIIINLYLMKNCIRL